MWFCVGGGFMGYALGLWSKLGMVVSGCLQLLCTSLKECLHEHPLEKVAKRHIACSQLLWGKHPQQMASASANPTRFGTWTPASLSGPCMMWPTWPHREPTNLRVTRHLRAMVRFSLLFGGGGGGSQLQPSESPHGGEEDSRANFIVSSPAPPVGFSGQEQALTSPQAYIAWGWRQPCQQQSASSKWVSCVCCMYACSTIHSLTCMCQP